MSRAYYNEIDPYAAQWLRNLISAGHIAPGDVDERSIVDVRADDLANYTQAHFFAGIGGWSVALRLAGWDDARPVWTGSCPCQPFSAAGAGKAADDGRHLWPRWFPLIRERRPAIVFGEQVEAAIGWGWLDAVFADLEGEGYACGATVLPACSVGAPHIRQRCWFVANHAEPGRQPRRRTSEASDGRDAPRIKPGRLRDAGELADADGGDASAEGLQRGREQRQQPQDGRSVRLADSDQPRLEVERVQSARSQCTASERSGAAGELGNATGDEQRQPRQSEESQRRPSAPRGSSAWSDLGWLPCTDGKARPVEPGTFPLAHGIPGRVGRLRAYGNAIVPQVAAEFISAFNEIEAPPKPSLTQI